jgi:hypothetical protein
LHINMRDTVGHPVSTALGNAVSPAMGNTSSARDLKYRHSQVRPCVVMNSGDDSGPTLLRDRCSVGGGTDPSPGRERFG